MIKKSALAISLFILVIITNSSSIPKKKENAKPNVLIILTDQWRGQALGFLKQEPVLTPNIDKLAAEGLTLNQAITNYPVCSPSRASMLTGKYPLQHQVYSNVNSNTAPYGVELPENIITWSDVLKANGYSNGYIGKWHLDSPMQPYVPTANNSGATAWNEWTAPSRRHGFDYWYAYGTYDDHTRPMYWDTYAKRNEFHYVNQWSPQHEANKAISFLQNKNNDYRDGTKPFSLVVSINPPHSEYKKVPKKYVSLYADLKMDQLLKDPNIPAEGTKMGDAYRENIRYYYACVTGVDDQVGRILSELKRSGLDKNTIVVFMADHGNCLGKHDEISKNTFYEESVRIPFIISWKGRISKAIDNDLLFTMADFYPSLLGLLNLPNPRENAVDGVDYSSFITQRKKEKLPETQFFMGAVNAPNKKSGFRGVRSNQYKLVYQGSGANQKKFLFNLKTDPFEMQNLYQENDPMVKNMHQQLKSWLQKTQDPFPLQ